MNYYNETRTHLSLDKDAPLSRTVQRAGRVLRLPILGGLHHQYIRIWFATGTGLHHRYAVFKFSVHTTHQNPHCALHFN